MSVRVRPMRSAIWPNRMPPAAQPSSRIDVQDPAPAAASPSGRLGRADREAQQRRHAVGRDVVEEQPVEDVEAPAEPGGEQHRPLVAVHVEHGRGAGRGRSRRMSGWSLSGRSSLTFTGRFTGPGWGARRRLGGVAEVDLLDHGRRVLPLARRRGAPRDERALVAVAARARLAGAARRRRRQRGHQRLPGGQRLRLRRVGHQRRQRDQSVQVDRRCLSACRRLSTPCRRFGRLAGSGCASACDDRRHEHAIAELHEIVGVDLAPEQPRVQVRQRRARLGARLQRSGASQRLVVVALRLAERAQHHVDQLAAALGIAGARRRYVDRATCGAAA